MKEQKMWLTRDKDGGIAISKNKPFKDEREELWTVGGQYVYLPDNWFPEVKWEDKEPTKVKFIINK